MEDEEILDGADASEEETPDPLAEVPEDQRQKFEQILAAERERIAAEAKQQAEVELQRHKQEVGTRLKERVRDFAGIEFDENNQPVLKDPNRVMGLLAGAQPPPPKDDPRPDPVYDPEGFIAWSERQAEKKAEEKLRPVLDEMRQLKSLFLGQTVAPATEQAKGVLDSYGLTHFAEHPDFGSAFQQALENLPLEQRSNPQAVEFAAMSVLPFLDRQKLPQPKRPTPPQGPDGRFQPNPARQGLSQTAPPRGYGRQGAATYTDAEREAADLAGMSVEEYRKYSSEDTAWG